MPLGVIPAFPVPEQKKQIYFKNYIALNKDGDN